MAENMSPLLALAGVPDLAGTSAPRRAIAGEDADSGEFGRVLAQQDSGPDAAPAPSVAPPPGADDGKRLPAQAATPAAGAGEAGTAAAGGPGVPRPSPAVEDFVLAARGFADVGTASAASPDSRAGTLELRSLPVSPLADALPAGAAVPAAASAASARGVAGSVASLAMASVSGDASALGAVAREGTTVPESAVPARDAKAIAATTATPATPPGSATALAEEFAATIERPVPARSAAAPGDATAGVAARGAGDGADGTSAVVARSSAIDAAAGDALARRAADPGRAADVASPALAEGRAVGIAAADAGSAAAALPGNAVASPAPGVAPSNATLAAGDADADYTLRAAPGDADFGDDLGAQVRVMLRDGVREARIQLHPAELGRLQVTVTADGDQARVLFIADTPAARDAIEQSLPRLREMLDEQGLQLAQSDVAERGAGGFDRSPRGSGGDAASAGRVVAEEPSVPAAVQPGTAAGRIDTYV